MTNENKQKIIDYLKSQPIKWGSHGGKVLCDDLIDGKKVDIEFIIDNDTLFIGGDDGEQYELDELELIDERILGKTMKQILILRDGITAGDQVRTILEIFPYIKESFRQRKTYDEYYFDGSTVELTIETIQSLIQAGFKVTLNHDEVIIS